MSTRPSVASAKPADVTGSAPGAFRHRVVDDLVDCLVDAGATHAFGIAGGAIALFVDAMRDRLKVIHCRHEGGAAFAATELSLATDRPAVVFTTTGPGLTNALTGIYAGRTEGARLVLVSGATPAARRGMHAFQETGSASGAWAWMSTASAPLDGFIDVRVDEPSDVRAVAHHIRHVRAATSGAVLRVLLSMAAQGLPSVERDDSGVHPRTGARPVTHVLGARECAELLGDRTVLWVGYGARHASDAVRRLAERRGWAVMATPRGKGIFPESHPLYLGVTGLGGHERVLDELARARPDHVVVLGSRLGEFTSFWNPGYRPAHAFVHVDVDPSVFGRAYPEVPTIGVNADIRGFAEALCAALPSGRGVPLRIPPPLPQIVPSPSSDRGIHPAAVMAAVQSVVVERSRAIVMTEAGNTFAWGSCALRFDEPRYRVSTGFGAMGQATAGVLGAALGSGRKAVALVGDGAMLMNHEINTAVQYAIPAVWIVFNDAKYGMVEHGMRAIGMEPHETTLPRVDFARLAEAVGAIGLRVETDEELVPMLELAMREPRPVVVDVRVDPDVPPPFGSRNASLRRQGMEVEP